MGFLSGIKNYALMALAALVGFLTIRNKFLKHENEELEEENAAKTIKEEISTTIEKASAEAEKNEEVKQSNIDDSDWRNSI